MQNTTSDVIILLQIKVQKNKSGYMACTYVRMCVCIYVSMYVSMWVYMHVSIMYICANLWRREPDFMLALPVPVVWVRWAKDVGLLIRMSYRRQVGGARWAGVF